MMKRLFHTFLLLIVAVVTPWPVHAKQSVGRKGGDDTKRFVVRYANAFANAQIEEWAASDLACLSRRKHNSAQAPTAAAQACWTATIEAHTAMTAQDPEPGVFDAMGRGMGFGLLHDRHRASEHWKDYPPAVFLSPPVVRRDHGPAPDIAVVQVSPSQPIALLNLAGREPVTVRGQAVDLRIRYPDPLTAPLALRPEEVWWVSGTQRRFGPVRQVEARFIVVSGLKQFGYPADRAVMNEAVPGAPVIPTTHYGLRPDAGRRFEAVSSDTLLKGELRPGSVRWWEREEAEASLRQAVNRAMHLPMEERAGLLTRLLLLDPDDADVHAMRGDDAYQAFLRQGVAKGGLSAQDEAALWRQAELYWTVQAQTWRQELTAVSEGYEPAADALYRAIASYQTLAQQHRATPEQRRRWGALTRWNNDPAAALGIHDTLLAELPPDSVEHGRVLADIPWDHIQWVSWGRRYDHPWLDQAAVEARRAAALLDSAHDRLVADYVLVVVESLRVPRDGQAFATSLERVKQDVSGIPGTNGMLGHLLANDLVKALTTEANAIVLPSQSRSPEVLDVAVHATPPKQDIVWQWNFDRDALRVPPSGFVSVSSPGAEAPDWQVLAEHNTTTSNQLVVQSRPCATADCAHLLVAERVHGPYPDVTVQVRDLSENGDGEAGLALAVRDGAHYYAITLNAKIGVVSTRRVNNGAATVLGQVSVKLAARPWHTIRVQRINFLHLDKGRLAVYVDGAQVAAVDDVVLPQEGRVGLITIGRSTAQFDGLHLLDLVSNRPLSKPAAY